MAPFLRVPTGTVFPLLLAAGLLMACQPGSPGGAGPARATAPVLGGSFALSTPPGYCVSRAASHDAGDSGVFLMGRCSSASDATPAVVAVTVGAPGSAVVLADGAAMAEWFTSPGGRAALSRGGRASDVRILSVTQRAGAYHVHLADRRAGLSWRAVLGLRGRLTSISVAVPGNDPVQDEIGGQLLRDAVDALVRANPAE